MSNYIDGFLIPVPKVKIDDYAAIASKASEIWMEHGALGYWECAGDDLEVKDLVSFRQSAVAGADDTVVFAWIVFESREHRDKVNAKVMADPRMNDMCDPENPPFNFKKMAYGGFRTLVRK